MSATAKESEENSVRTAGCPVKAGPSKHARDTVSVVKGTTQAVTEAPGYMVNVQMMTCVAL